ncbi:MAG: hypothetical protein MAG451_03178 [Anaerolineales bacterium]|nr:hypothetical protein [Anaerolineales bacterium]
MFDWQTGEDRWEVPEERERQPRRRQLRIPRPASRWLLALAAVLLVIFGGAVIFLRWKSNQQLAQLRQDIQATVDTEAWAYETRNVALYRSLLDPTADPRWREIQAETFQAAGGRPAPKMTVVDVTLSAPDLAVAELKVDPAREKPYPTTRAYRRTGGMWLETSTPNGQIWLKQVSRETQNLRFVFHRRDWPRLATVMPAIQELYAQLLEDLWLSPPQGKRTLHVILSVRPITSELPDDPTYYDLSDLGSEAEVEVIKRRLGALLLDRIMNLFRSGEGDLSFLIRAVEEWEYAAWLDTLPVPGGQVAFGQDLLVSLPFLSLTGQAWKWLEHPAARAAAGQALVSYVVRMYGRDTLADIARGAQQYDNWYPFVTHALHVSQILRVPFVEFDAGWRNYALRTFTERPGTRSGALSSEWATFLLLLSAEQRAVGRNDWAGYERLLAKHGDSEWLGRQRQRFETYQDFLQRTNAPFRLELGDSIVHGSEALLRVVVHFPDPGSIPYQEIRTYQRFDGEWKWTATPASFWGSNSREGTSHLRFQFNRQDAEVVREQMPATETFFLRLLHDLDVAPRSGEWPESLVGINVVPGYGVLDWRDGETGIRILSPVLGGIATEMPPSDFYRMSTGLALARRVVAARAGPADTPFADALLEAIARWEVEQWASELPWTEPRRRAVRGMLQSEVRPSLRGRLTWTELRVEPTIGYLYDTAVAYLVEAHGRAKLGEVIQRASRYESWGTLIPDVLGVEFDDFEAGWHEYLEVMGAGLGD